MHSMKASNTKIKVLIFLIVALSGAFAIYWFQKLSRKRFMYKPQTRSKLITNMGCLRSLFTSRVTLAFVCIAKP